MTEDAQESPKTAKLRRNAAIVAEYTKVRDTDEYTRALCVSNLAATYEVSEASIIATLVNHSKGFYIPKKRESAKTLGETKQDLVAKIVELSEDVESLAITETEADSLYRCSKGLLKKLVKLMS